MPDPICRSRFINAGMAAPFCTAPRRNQGFVDHRFYRFRHDAARQLRRFRSVFRDQVDIQSLSSDLVVVARGALD